MSQFAPIIKTRNLPCHTTEQSRPRRAIELTTSLMRNSTITRIDRRGNAITESGR